MKMANPKMVTVRKIIGSYQIIHSLLSEREGGDKGNAVLDGQLDEPLPLLEHQPDLVLLPVEGLAGAPGHQHRRDPLLDLQQALHASARCCASSQPGMGLQ